MPEAPWPPRPVIYEINTWLWLDRLSRDAGTAIALDRVPPAEWDRLAAMAVDAVWLMGVWERSPAGTEVMRANRDLCRDSAELLSDFTGEDLVGSPYCVRRYVPDPRMGGLAGLRAAHHQLRTRGLKLLLDFVPNHVAPDHPWVAEHPDYLIGGDERDLELHPGEFTRIPSPSAGRGEPGGSGIVAFGRDPFSPPWTDVVQVNAFHPGVRAETTEMLSDLAEVCDGVRCDMAMLAIREVFARTWGARAGPTPAEEYWTEVIGAVRNTKPDFLFIAEAYWDREWDLLQQGFDFCYDKVLYDRVMAGDGPAIRSHLGADIDYQRRLVRFVENHDEDRVAAVLPPDAARAAAVTIATLPGATLYFDGQFQGYRRRLPVALGRRPPEEAFPLLEDFYRRLLTVARDVRRGAWSLCPVTGWPDNQSCLHIVAWAWEAGDATFVVAINFSDAPAQGQVRFPVPAWPGRPREIVAPDLLSGEKYPRDPAELAERGLYVGLAAHGVHVLRFSM